MSRIQPREPGEIYEDSQGGRWIVISLCNEPTVTMQRIEPWSDASRQGGGVSGLMWQGFRKILDAPNPKELSNGDD